MEQFDDIVRASYDRDVFPVVEVHRFMAILNFKAFFFDSVDFSGYGAAKTNSKKAKREGGRDLNILYMRFKLEDGVPCFRYKYYETDPNSLFLPPSDKPPIKVSNWFPL